MKGGHIPVHIQRWSPADYQTDPYVKLLLRRQDYETLTFYRQFIDISFLQGGDLPADIELLAAAVDMPEEAVSRALERCLNRLVFVDGDRLYQLRVRREIRKELEFRDGQGQSGYRGGKASGAARRAKAQRRLSEGSVKASLQGHNQGDDGDESKARPKATLKAHRSPPAPTPAPTPSPSPTAAPPSQTASSVASPPLDGAAAEDVAGDDAAGADAGVGQGPEAKTELLRVFAEMLNSRPTAGDGAVAVELAREGVSPKILRAAMVLALGRTAGNGSASPRSLAYFRPVIEELLADPNADGRYLDYVITTQGRISAARRAVRRGS
jgi:hypothetical protein